MIIYKITHIKSGKSYIGQTTQPLAERIWQHTNRSPSQKHRSSIHNAIKRYGIDSFTIETLASASSIEELNMLEIELIAKHNTLAPNGYNLLKGGGNKECHPDTKARISETLKGRPHGVEYVRLYSGMITGAKG